MRNRKNFVIVSVFVTACLVLAWMAGGLQGQSNELRNEISVPMQQTDAGRAIDAYERMMARYMDISEGNMAELRFQIAETNHKIDILLAKIENIERALKIEQPKAPAAEPSKVPVRPAEFKKDVKPLQITPVKPKSDQ
jgi:thiamine monophosphate kinase